MRGEEGSCSRGYPAQQLTSGLFSVTATYKESADAGWHAQSICTFALGLEMGSRRIFTRRLIELGIRETPRHRSRKCPFQKYASVSGRFVWKAPQYQDFDVEKAVVPVVQVRSYCQLTSATTSGYLEGIGLRLDWTNPLQIPFLEGGSLDFCSAKA